MTARTLWLIRHGHRLDWQDQHWAATAHRPHDPPLSDCGHREAQALAHRLQDETVDHIFSSAFLRCLETASALAAQQDLPIAVEYGLSEWLNAEWVSTTPVTAPMVELVKRFRIDWSYRSLGQARYGESGVCALRRSAATARAITGHFGGNLVLVGHGASVLGAVGGLLESEPGRRANLRTASRSGSRRNCRESCPMHAWSASKATPGTGGFRTSLTRRRIVRAMTDALGSTTPCHASTPSRARVREKRL